MKPSIYTIIAGSGSYIPTRVITNANFQHHAFYDQQGVLLEKKNETIIAQFEKITGIRERRYVTDELNTSDIAFLAAKTALENANIDGEDLDHIIVAHNFGDISVDNFRSEMVPALASRVKQLLDIDNPDTIAYDLPFGCAGWLQGVIQGDQLIKAGHAKKILVIGADTLSRICDPHDRDSMIFSDGAGAVVLTAVESETPIGILGHITRSFSGELTHVLKMGKSFGPGYQQDRLFLKMQGRKLYEQVLKIVPGIIKSCLDKTGLGITDMSKLLIHQANNKMDEAILKQLFESYGLKSSPEGIMPMTIAWLGNSSVATLPTLYDLIAQGDFEGQQFDAGDVLVFAAVGAGVNVNALAYRV